MVKREQSQNMGKMYIVIVYRNNMQDIFLLLFGVIPKYSLLGPLKSKEMTGVCIEERRVLWPKKMRQWKA